MKIKKLIFVFSKLHSVKLWIKTSFITLFIKQNNLSSTENHFPALTLLPYLNINSQNKVIRLEKEVGLFATKVVLFGK